MENFQDDQQIDTSGGAMSIDEYDEMVAKEQKSGGKVEGQDQQTPETDIDGGQDTDDDEQDSVAYEDAEAADDQQQTDEEQKHVQTPEERAFYAEQRRQREEAQRQVLMQQQLEQMRRTMPEYQIAQILQETYGMSPQEMLMRLQEAKIAREAQVRGVTPDVLRREQDLARQQQMMQAQQQMMQIQSFQQRMELEGIQVKNKYPSLTREEMTNAVGFMLQNNQLHMPLEYAVRALYGDKLYQASQDVAKQEALAAVSGRMNKGIVPPMGGKAPKTTQLTEEEKYFARQMGISEEEYAKYKL